MVSVFSLMMLEKVAYMCFCVALSADFFLCIREKPRFFCTVGVLGAFRARSQGFYAPRPLV